MQKFLGDLKKWCIFCLGGNSHCMGYQGRTTFWGRFFIGTEIFWVDFLTGLKLLGLIFKMNEIFGVDF